ncbi:hypothetical protein SAMN05880574_11542 [Chryseobacterium sp. RU37D]|nr:hypothetical protein SAMN05880574_11542 [Chryseobacterium sp. RU37D]
MIIYIYLKIYYVNNDLVLRGLNSFLINYKKS